MTAHGMCGRFEILESARHFRIEFESNLEASQVPNISVVSIGSIQGPTTQRHSKKCLYANRLCNVFINAFSTQQLCIIRPVNVISKACSNLQLCWYYLTLYLGRGNADGLVKFFDTTALIHMKLKKCSQRRKHCTLAVVRRSQKCSPRRRPTSRGAGWPKFNQLEMVTTFIYIPSLVKIDERNFELSWK